MAKPSSQTAIANLALGHLKIDPVVSIDPPDSDSKAATAAAKWYDQARRDTLEAHPWNFASKRTSIASESSAPAFEYTKKYQVPPDFIRVNRIGEKWDDPILDFEIEQDYILCDESTPLKLKYVYDIKDVSKFSPKFITALSYKLAAFLAYEMTGNASLVEAMENQFERAMTQAASVDGQNRPTRRIQRSRLRDARRNVGRYRDAQNWGSD